MQCEQSSGRCPRFIGIHANVVCRYNCRRSHRIEAAVAVILSRDQNMRYVDSVRTVFFAMHCKSIYLPSDLLLILVIISRVQTITAQS